MRLFEGLRYGFFIIQQMVIFFWLLFFNRNVRLNSVCELQWTLTLAMHGICDKNLPYYGKLHFGWTFFDSIDALLFLHSCGQRQGCAVFVNIISSKCLCKCWILKCQVVVTLKFGQRFMCFWCNQQEGSILPPPLIIIQTLISVMT